MLKSSRLHLKEFTFDKSSTIKQTIYQKLRYLNGNTVSFIPHVCYFSYQPWIATSEECSLTTLLYQNEEEETQPEGHQHLCLILFGFHHSFPPM